MNRTKVVACSAGLALVVAVAGAQTVLSRLGVSEAHAHEIAMSGIEGSFSVGTVAKTFLALPPAGRVAAVNDLVAWVKIYYASPIFKDAWAKQRDNAKPQADSATGSVDDAVKAELATEQKSLDDARKLVAALPADSRAGMEAMLKQQEATLKDPQHIALVRQQIVAQRGDSAKHNDADMKKWQEEFPADYNVVLARRLRQFLATSADVNFDAKVVVTDGRKTFADPQYESKSGDWKMCYRAGREATQAARAAATAWLKEIGK